LGAYEIVAPLGAGGMGEVYRRKIATNESATSQRHSSSWMRQPRSNPVVHRRYRLRRPRHHGDE
jgi:hypothetical protein